MRPSLNLHMTNASIEAGAAKYVHRMIFHQLDTSINPRRRPKAVIAQSLGDVSTN
jgi:hypothetical protein